MLVQIKDVKHEWKSDDGRVHIWSLTNGIDGSRWQTRSEKIAGSEGQTMELTTTVSKSNKTYLIQIPREDSDSKPAQAAVPQETSLKLDNAVMRIEMAVDAFERAVDRWLDRQGVTSPGQEPAITDIPDTDPLQRAKDVFGEGTKIQNDIRLDDIPF